MILQKMHEASVWLRVVEDILAKVERPSSWRRKAVRGARESTMGQSRVFVAVGKEVVMSYDGVTLLDCQVWAGIPGGPCPRPRNGREAWGRAETE